MEHVLTPAGGLARLTRGVVRTLGAGGLGLLSVIWCLDAVLPPVRYQQVHYLVSSGTKGWDLLSGYDAEGQAFKIRYLRSSGAIPEGPGQRGVAQELLTSRLPMLGSVIGSDLLAVTRLEHTPGRGTRERHWEMSLLGWWMRMLAHVLGGVTCGAVAVALTVPYVRRVQAWRAVGIPWRRWRRRPLVSAESAEPGDDVPPAHPLLATAVRWQSTADPFFPYAVQVSQEWWEIRLNDFPAEPLYTLMVEGNAVVDFDTWPAHWDRPDAA